MMMEAMPAQVYIDDLILLCIVDVLAMSSRVLLTLTTDAFKFTQWILLVRL